MYMKIEFEDGKIMEIEIKAGTERDFEPLIKKHGKIVWMNVIAD